MWGETGLSSRDSQRTTFQSTHPVWGETSFMFSAYVSVMNFNPLTPCGVRPVFFRCMAKDEAFQSTHPVWGETTKGKLSYQKENISIHSPRVG